MGASITMASWEKSGGDDMLSDLLVLCVLLCMAKFVK